MSDTIRTFKHFVRVPGQLDPDADRLGIYINYDKRFVATPLFFREFVTGDHRTWLCLRLHRVVVDMNAAGTEQIHGQGKRTIAEGIVMDLPVCLAGIDRKPVADPRGHRLLQHDHPVFGAETLNGRGLARMSAREPSQYPAAVRRTVIAPVRQRLVAERAGTERLRHFGFSVMELELAL